eukprot:NODE_3315_length_570_cov_322.309021_g2795_i0.p2 GENE.NODE_3315_length_570_cov_322.309021_g2795_i0~~NODE_3315_length_570_cov_322.309021_g2795_i0.p2  ORF type:complete len:56 (+),score=8.05 NODE_3315_length_570_cov_322.309021_g2795_i0:78-245(+)
MPKGQNTVDPEKAAEYLHDDMIEDEVDSAHHCDSKSGGKCETGKHAPHKDRSVNM